MIGQLILFVHAEIYRLRRLSSYFEGGLRNPFLGANTGKLGPWLWDLESLVSQCKLEDLKDD